MNVNVLLFASYADALGTSALQLDLPERAVVRDVVTVLRGRTGGAQVPPAPLVAINRSYAAMGDEVRAGDEIAIIPPVAGG